MILAVDASTSKVGWSIWDGDKIVSVDGWKYKTNLTLLQKNSLFHENLKVLTQLFPIDTFVIEKSKESMRSFGKKQVSNTKTVKILNQINFGMQYAAFTEGLKVYDLDENILRKLAYPSYKQNRSGKIKDQYFALVEQEYPEKLNFKKTLKSGVRKSQTVYEDFVEDIADSIIVGKGYVNLLKEGLTPEDLETK